MCLCLLLRARRLSREEFLALFQKTVAIVNNTPLRAYQQILMICPDDSASLSTLKQDSFIKTPNDYDDKYLLPYGKKRWRRFQFLAEQFCLSRKTRKQDYLLRNLEVRDVIVVMEDIAYKVIIVAVKKIFGTSNNILRIISLFPKDLV